MPSILRSFQLAACLSLVCTIGLAGAQSPEQHPQNPEQRPLTPQQVLDRLSDPKFYNVNQLNLPPTYAEWSPQQQHKAPSQILGRCTALWGMMNPNGSLQLLPTGEDPTDSNKLAVEICVAAHTPADWPARPATLRDIHHILDRSAALGAPLTLPPSLR